MKTVSASDLKNKTGQFVESVVREPVQIYKSGRAVAVALPQDEYERLVAIEDAYWAGRAHQAEVRGYASKAEVSKLLKAAHHA